MVDNVLGNVGGFTRCPSDSFTRPANTTAYESGDLVANNATAGSVVALEWRSVRDEGGSGMIRRAAVRKSGTSTTNASFRVHFYTADPTCANGDNGAWSTDNYDAYLGFIDVTVDKAFTDGAAGHGSPTNGSEINFDLAAGNATIYGLIEATAAYTPSSAEVFNVQLEVLQN